MFFDPDDYLKGEAQPADSRQEVKRLKREAGQRAALCEAMTRVAAERGVEALGGR
ncbi:MAG TPA: hypothetical protein VFD37_03440 [Solirubrobacterales bacterium]|nr:hypothetical protein [Solirubrobacterales bacterium]